MSSDSEPDDVPLLHPSRVEDARSQLLLKDFFAAFVSVLMVALGITAIALVYSYQTSILDEYSVVLDAGSTHTELIVYKWSRNNVIHGTALVKQINSCQGTGGSISSYAATDPYKAGSSLEGCIKNTAEKVVPFYQQSRTPIYLGATAGMRLVQETDPSIAEDIMVSVRQTLHRSPFNFEDEHARIITGEEEGLSSWVTVNYLSGGLFFREISSNGSIKESSDHLKGALDMGGASTQITFSARKDMHVPPQFTQDLRLYGRTNHLYTHSYLCYGKKEAERRFMASLIKNSTTDLLIENPCGAKGLVENRTTKYLWKPPCVEVPIGRPLNNTNITFQGTANVSECISKVQKLFNFTSCTGSSNCSFDGVYQPSTEDVKFVAFSSYYYVAKDLNLTQGGDNITLVDFKTAGDRLCNETWSKLKTSANNSTATLAILKGLCFDAQYVYTFLSRAYHVNDSSTNIAFQNSIHGRSLGWALGFMVNATNLLPTEKPEYRVKPEAFIAVVIVGAVLISLGILLGIMATRRVVKRRELAPRGLTI